MCVQICARVGIQKLQSVFTGIISVPTPLQRYGAQGKVSIEDMVTGPDSINVLAMGLKTVQDKVQSANAQSPRPVRDAKNWVSEGEAIWVRAFGRSNTSRPLRNWVMLDWENYGWGGEIEDSWKTMR